MSAHSQAMPDTYAPTEREPYWYRCWESAGLFQPQQAAQTYTIAIPPPNITGSLHMGHALCYSIHDALARYMRMTGKSVQVIPGQDHAGIATQAVVLKNLRSRGIQISGLTREQFLDAAWSWREESGGAIINQLKLLGCAFDWSALRFTLDDDYSHAVKTVFVDWFDRGLIHQKLRVVNWDPVLKTSVSDLEVERRDTKGSLYHVRYPLADGSGFITIATTRPETILADVAVAVNPSDSRYRHLIGKQLLAPLTNRLIPLIEDHYPDPGFGSGAVKITPGHDADDFEVGERHQLPIIVMLMDDGRVSKEFGPYAGLDRKDARKQVVADLETNGFIDRVEEYTVPLLISSRSGEPIEPLASLQWFVNQEPLRQQAIDAVTSGQISFHPNRYQAVYLEWMNNLRDWCVSRQLWWGHRIPVYRTKSGKFVAAMSWEQAQEKAGNDPLESQEEDVLDTWFSSGTWPFAVQGWPGNSTPVRYPTDALVTARDILFLWVARMIMMGLDQLGQVPFRDVAVYATVLTEDGRRMSKSLGTGVDPLTVISEYGADSLRWTLLSQSGTNQDIRYSESRVVEARNFSTKVWNAARFVLSQVPEGFQMQPLKPTRELDRWILSKLAECVDGATSGLTNYNYQEYCRSVSSFFWRTFCDWYIEVAKPALKQEKPDQQVLSILIYCMERSLQLLHPVMPHLTEEVMSFLRNDRGFIVEQAWPTEALQFRDEALESQVDSWIECVTAVRALRAEFKITPLKVLPEVYVEPDLPPFDHFLRTQAWFHAIRPGRPATAHASTNRGPWTFHIPLGDVVDLNQERARAEKQFKATHDEMQKLRSRLEDRQFLTKANSDAVKKQKDRLEQLRLQALALESRINSLSE